MPVIGSMSAELPRFISIGFVISMLLLPIGCTPTPSTTSAVDLKLYQKWELQPGDTVGGRSVLGGLGDISIALNGNRVYAPFDGKAQLDQRRCLLFSSPDVPAYQFRLCGLDNPRLGDMNQGDALGSGQYLEFAALRKQPNGTWAIIEPARTILERTLTRK